MKVLLINPPSLNTITADNPSFLDEERGYNPPLGIMYLAGHARKFSRHEISIIDADVEKLNYSDLKESMANRRPDIVGITAMTFTMVDVMKVVSIVKSISPDIITVLGGPHPTIYPEETIQLPGVDFVVMGEGEIVFTQFLNSLGDRSSLKKIKSLVYKEDGSIINLGRDDFIDHVDELPYPARDLTPYKEYFSILTKERPVTTMFTSRGCPYRCSFCYRPHMGRKFRARSPQNVVDEMEECLNMGIKEILFYDDTFTVDRRRVIEICREIMKKGLAINWDIRARVDLVDKEMLGYLKKANCKRIHYGIEAGSERALKELNKNISLNQAEEAIKLTKESGISTLAYFMIGSPGERREDIFETIRFMQKLAPDYVHITLTTPFPETELYNRALREGVINEDYWRAFARDPSRPVTSRYWEKELTRGELLDLLDYSYKKFYSRPKYIFSELSKISSIRDLRNKFKTGIRILCRHV